MIPKNPETGYWCLDCGGICEPKAIDVGYGFTDAWGRPYNHVCMVWASDCCESTLYKDPECEEEFGTLELENMIGEPV